MKRTNYQIFDFLDINPDLDGEEYIWIAQKPKSVEIQNGDAVVSIPFQRIKQGKDIVSDIETELKYFNLIIRAYGQKTVRVAIAFEGKEMQDSEMLEFHSEMSVDPLHAEKKETCWIIYDSSNKKRAEFCFDAPEINYWSNLIPPAEPGIDVSFFPDGKKEIRINSYDRFFPARCDAFALAFVEKKGIPDRATLSIYAEPNEIFCGTGERFSKADLSGQTFQLKNQDGQGVNNRRTYKNIPFYLSNRMYGCFLHTSAYAKIALADHSSRSVQLLSEDPQLDVFLYAGASIEDILFEYRKTTGFPSLPPLWSYGIWMSRMSYFSANEVNEICNKLTEHQFPFDVIHLDTGWFRTDWLCEWKFNPERFPNPKQFIQQLKSKGIRISLWQMPYIAKEAEQHNVAFENRFICRLKQVEKQGGSNFSALDYAGTIDFTNPEAVSWYKNLLRNLLEMGVTCIKTDFGEEIHLDADYHALDARKLNNLYALLYQKAAFEVTKEVTGEGIIWARAGWAGCQRYPLHWGGDAASSWDGMAGSLKGGLHLGLSGFAFWSHDVPGFHGVPDFMNSAISNDLYVRWTQFGVFSSHIRYHGTSKREPYHYPEIEPVIRQWWNLRYTLIPYIMEQAEISSQTGFPLLQSLIFHHPDDKMCWHISDQYYFGNDFLVAPVMNSEGTRDIYLPEGVWINFFDGTVTNGNSWLINYHTPLNFMPVWVRLDAEIPVYPDIVKCTDEMNLSKIKKLIVTKSFKGIFNLNLNEL